MLLCITNWLETISLTVIIHNCIKELETIQLHMRLVLINGLVFYVDDEPLHDDNGHL